MIKQCIYAVLIVVLFAGSAYADIWQSLEKGDVQAVRDELAKGIDVNSQATDGRTLLIHALYSDQVDVAKMLIAQGADVKKAVERDIMQGQTALHWARDAELVKMLLARGADVNAKDADGNTPLHVAAVKAPRDVVELLVAHGADRNAKDDRDRTPMHCAAIAGQKDAVELLITDSNLSAHDNSGATPLHDALEYNHDAVAKLLIEKGADVNAKDKYDIPPLNIALEKCFVDSAKLLIDKGADINAKCKHNRTPLHFAAYNGLKDMVELLLAKGADATVRTTDGDCYNCTPLDWAKVQNQKEVVEILRSK